MSMYKIFNEHKIEFCSVNDTFDTTTPMGRGMLKIAMVFAEMERNILSYRVKSGMKNAAAKGKKIGRPTTTSDNLPDKFWKYYQQYLCDQINITEFALLMSCTRASIYKYIKIAEMGN